ncbi:MAG: hypothetical protein RRY36_08125 [Bacteroidaceae bacterium]
MFREIKLAINCKDDTERNAVQEVAKRLCNEFQPTAEDVIQLYAMYEKNQALFNDVVATMKRDGKKGLVKLVPILMKNI